MDSQDNSDLAAAAAAALEAPQFHHALQQPDFSAHHHHHHSQQQQDHQQQDHHIKVDDGTGDLVGLDQHDPNQHDPNEHDLDVDVHGLEIPDDVTHDDLNLDLNIGTPHDVDLDIGVNDYRRPPTIRKACDLCHAAKQKCSGDRPTCTRCAAGGWQCVYAPRQRRRTVPKEQRASSVSHEQPRSQTMSIPPPQQMIKKRKMAHRDSSFGDGIDMQRAMGMAMDMGLAVEEEGEEMMSMSDDQMLEAIAIDGYLADLPLATFVHNLPYQAPPQNDPPMTFNPDDFPGDMDQHTTSALREAIFSLHESGGGGGGQVEGPGDQGEGEGAGGQDETDPHLALLDLSMPGDEQNDSDANNLSGLGNFPANTSCNHATVIPHVLSLLASQPLEPKSGANTPLTLSVFSPLARSLRLFNSVTSCPNCSASPHQTLPQLALLSRTTTILTFPFPPIEPASGQTAQIQIHGARLAGTGVSQAIEQHIVGVIWDSWRASVREVFAAFERKAQEVITQTAMASSNNENGTSSSSSSSETQRAGLMFQAMSRLVTAMDEVEG